MLSPRALIGVVTSALLVAGIASGCSDDAALAGGAQGGSGGTTSTTSTSTDSSSSSTTTTEPNASFVALPCSSDADCGDDPDAHCIQPLEDEPAFTGFFGLDDVVGGPGGGYCSKPCEVDSECPHDSVCVRGICMLECVFGEPPLDTLFDPIPADKCHGRDDLMCVPTQGGNALCLPVCGDDGECAGRQCDLRTRVCTDAGRDGLPLGAGPCSPDDPGTVEDEDACAGFCLTFVDDANEPVSHMCSANCSLGGALDLTLNCGGPEQGLCLLGYPFDIGNSELGDYGYCAGACVQHDECNFGEGLFCFDVGLWQDVGKGYCLAPLPCPLGDECASDEACYDTAYGPVCLQADGNGDPLLPLGEAAGSGGAGGSGGG